MDTFAMLKTRLTFEGFRFDNGRVYDEQLGGKLATEILVDRAERSIAITDTYTGEEFETICDFVDSLLDGRAAVARG